MGTFYEVFNKGGGTRWKADYRLRRKDGKYANAEGRAYIVRAADGSPKRVIGAISDHTQQQTLEGQLRQSQKMEAIGRLAGGIAHDFNNILTVIRMSSEFVLAEMPQSDDKYEDAQEIIKASDRASKLTRQLLAFSRHQVLNPTVVILNEIVHGMDGMLRRVLPENIELVTDLAPDLRSVRADIGQMEQVLLNLVINAADAMPNGGQLSVRTSNATLDSSFSAKHLAVPPGQHVCLTVSDTGVGMDEATVAKIFEPFFTTKRVGKGTGLGLSTVHGIVTQSGGTVWVYSEPALGTTFKVFLPKAEGISTPTKTRVVDGPAAPTTETILLAEDEESTRVAIHRNLVRVGYTVIDAPNGVEALNCADSYPGRIDLLLTDSMMPEMGGAELVGYLRERRSGIKVLMMSGYTEGIGPGSALDETEMFIEKPFSTADLLLAIRSALRGVKK
jgi:signal transduction histidine kinase/ActR/RegA family two-component response regulator